jgi:sodium transport system permease protein
MNFTNVKLILAREVRDQLRDRRTLFMIFVLPVLLYPLLGSVFVKMRQFQSEKPMSVLVFGGTQLEKSPTPLIDGKHFSPSLFPEGSEASKLLELTIADEHSFKADADRLVREKNFDAALVFPPDFAQRLDAYRKAIQEATARARGTGFSKDPGPLALKEVAASPVPGIPRPKIIYTAANDGSLMAFNRLTVVLDRWTEEVGRANLVAGGLPAEAVRPFEVDSANLAGPTASKATNLWSRILPVLLLLWAMTGAFYPAIDLCAGEKERGTLETLLSSPAERSEIVLGKLLTIMVFSMVTAALNLICVGLIGALIFRQLPGFGGPPPLAVVWLVLAMVPISALFSALCLALASFARSTKEGQYYLMPLLMLAMPLAVLPIMPGMELSMGNALVPISGLVLLLKTLLEGSYSQALQFLPVVLAVTLAACWLSVRWAVEQFSTESVLFRESERFHLGLWLKQLLRDRGPLPTPAQGLFCGVLILALSFVFGSSVTPSPGFKGFAQIDIATQVVVILVPALALAWMLTSNPRRTLLLKLPRWQMLPAAAVLAVALHPFIVVLGSLVVWLYPISTEFQAKIVESRELFASANVWLLVLLAAALPAICEELAFRGFILSAFRTQGDNRRAIIISALFFGVAHGLLQQSISAFVTGLVLGWLAVQCGSLLPGVAFHFVHNSLMVLISKVTPDLIERFPALGLLVHSTNEGPSYQWPVYVLGGVASLALLGWLAWFPKARASKKLLPEPFTSTDSMKGGAPVPIQG